MYGLLVQVLSAVCLVVVVVKGAAIKTNVRLLSRNIGYYDTYDGNFDYTVENFLVLPYYQEYNGFSGSTFPAAEVPNGVRWEFIIYPRRTMLDTGEKVVGIDLKVVSLPSNASYILVTLQCGIVDYWGNEQYVKKTPEVALQGSGRAVIFKDFIKRDILVSKAKELLPAGNLNLKCSVKGFLTYKTDKIKMYSEEQKPKEELSASGCSKELASDTVKRLSNGDFNLQPDVVLESSGKQFKRHKTILSARSPLFAEIFNKSNNYLDIVTVFNFTNEMNAMELEDLLTFLYQGTAIHLDQTCRALYVVAHKYQLDCLKVTCEEVLMKNVRSTNALDLQTFAVKNGAIRLMKLAAACVSKFPDECIV